MKKLKHYLVDSLKTIVIIVAIFIGVLISGSFIVAAFDSHLEEKTTEIQLRTIDNKIASIEEYLYGNWDLKSYGTSEVRDSVLDGKTILRFDNAHMYAESTMDGEYLEGEWILSVAQNFVYLTVRLNGEFQTNFYLIKLLNVTDENPFNDILYLKSATMTDGNPVDFYFEFQRSSE